MSSFLKLDQSKLTECAAELMVYFERHKIMDIVTRVMVEISLVRPETPEAAQFWIATNIKRIADEIYRNCLDISFNGSGEAKFYQLPGSYLYRAVIFGRRGSGRKSQAVALAKRFNLIYIDAEQLIYQNLRNAKDGLSNALQEAFTADNPTAKSQALTKILGKRLLQMDALHHGWVMVNYPSNITEVQELFEHFQVPPNKFVYLQCPEVLALRRLVAQPNLGRPQDNCSYMEREMQYFNQNESDINTYLNRRHETIYIDATPCYEVVKTHLLSFIEKRPYVMGFKY